MTTFGNLASSALLLVLLSTPSYAFVNNRPAVAAVAAVAFHRPQAQIQSPLVVLSSVSDDAGGDSAFVPPPETAAADDDADDADAEEEEEDADDTLDKVENLTRKSKRGGKKKKKGSASKKPAVSKSALAPEEVYYEGPPAITETIIPTISILTVVGIIPAAAAWARQAWVRYRITSRRIRVTSGLGGKDMAEIVYPDIVEIRTAKRLFGDGDLVAFLRDGAKFEMRNVPDFEATLEFILDQVDPEVAALYREKGDVTLREK